MPATGPFVVDAALSTAAQRVGFSRLRRLHSTDRSVLIFELRR